MHRTSSLSRVAGFAICAACVCGCASPNQLAKLTAEKEQLVATIDAEKKLNADLTSRLQLASQRAGEAERELALLHGGKPSAGLVSTPSRSSSAAINLEQWSRKQSFLRYDARRRAARVDLDLAFDNTNGLSLDSRRSLDRVADLLAGSDAARYGVVISGISGKGIGDAQLRGRTDAVVEWLAKRGLGSNRVVTSQRGGSALVDEEGRKLNATRSIELEIVELTGRADAVANEPSRPGDGWISSERR